ncbi:hypothetical protein [Phenylobacterium sp.]|uniref:hypothetical protein n=1 Tax=Phenylobacterium sp. TaxID=1871053 RepID=UPI00301B86DB
MRGPDRNAPSAAARSPSPAGGGGPAPSTLRPTAWRAHLARGLALAAAPGLAFAHPGHHEELTLAQQAWHLVSEPDHLLAFAALVAVIAAGGWTWARRRAGK